MQRVVGRRRSYGQGVRRMRRGVLFFGLSAMTLAVSACAPATTRPLAPSAGASIAVGSFDLPVGGVYGSPALVWNRDGNLILLLTGRGVRFAEYSLRVRNERGEDVPILAYQIDTHHQIRRDRGVPRESVLSTWNVVLSARGAARHLSVSLTRNRPHHYEVKWDRVEVPRGETSVH
jgi:hypothetical protein